MVHFLLQIKIMILNHIPGRKAGVISLAQRTGNGPRKEMVLTMEEGVKEKCGNMVCLQIPQPINKKWTTVFLSIKKTTF